MSEVRTIKGPQGPIAKLLNARDTDVDDVLLSPRGRDRSIWQWCLFEDGSLALVTFPVGSLNRSLRQCPALAPLFEKPKVKLYCSMAFNRGSYATSHSTDPGTTDQYFNNLVGERLKFEIEVPENFSSHERAAAAHQRAGQIYSAIWAAQEAK